MRTAWFLVGPTAAGKSAVAQELAGRTGAAILSADAMLVYRGMDIGTAKPTVSERGVVRYYGLDLVDPDRPFSVGEWLALVRAQLADSLLGLAVRAAATTIGCAPPAGVEPSTNDLIVTGGTGLYLRALAAGLDAPAANPDRRRYWQARLAREGLDALRRELCRRAPEAAARLADPDNPRRVLRALEHLDAGAAPPDGWRVVPRPRAAGLRLPRIVLHARIAARVAAMFAGGLLDEAAALRARFPAWADFHTSRGVKVAPDASPAPFAEPACTACGAIGYAEALDVLDGRLTTAQAGAQIEARTRQLAKRQETWLRHQADVVWVDVGPDEPADAVATRVLAVWRQHGPTPIALP